MFSNKSHCPALKIGDKGQDTVILQELLWDEKFYMGPIDGNFGYETQRAVIALQKSEDLLAHGVVDPHTWAVLGMDCHDLPDGESSYSRCPTDSSAHTIRLGDSLYGISIQYKTTVNSIIKANPNINPNQLKAGQTICIP